MTRSIAQSRLDVEIGERFARAVNMTSKEIRAWLETSESRSVGFKPAGARESIGRQSARRIVRILESGVRSPSDLTHMRKVTGYIARHLAQRPEGDVRDTRWRYSLMNWGHDPLKM